MSQYKPNLNHAVVKARLQARLVESNRFAAEPDGNRRRRRFLSSRRRIATGVHELLSDPGVVSGLGLFGPIR